MTLSLSCLTNYFLFPIHAVLINLDQLQSIDFPGKAWAVLLCKHFLWVLGHMRRWMYKWKIFLNTASLPRANRRWKRLCFDFHIFFTGNAQPWLFIVYKSLKELVFCRADDGFLKGKCEGEKKKRNVAKRQKYCIWNILLDLNV